MKRIALAFVLVLVLILSGIAGAQSVPITDLSERAHVTVNGGAMFHTAYDWSGAAVGGTVLYNLHQRFSVYGAYDHGFTKHTDDDVDAWRAIGSLNVNRDVFLGGGYAWFGGDMKGGIVQLVVRKGLAARLDVAALYARVYPDAAVDNFNFAKVCLNYHLLGKE